MKIMLAGALPPSALLYTHYIGTKSFTCYTFRYKTLLIGSRP